jgi:hypothetical protein
VRTDVAVAPGATQRGSRLAADRDGARRIAGVLATATLLGAVAYGCVAQGGFYPDQQRTLLALTAASGVLAALAAPARRVLSHVAVAVPACVCAIVAAAWARDLGGAAPVLGIVGAAASAALVGRAAFSEGREALLSGLVVAGAALAAMGWVGVAFRIDPLALVDQGLWRASSTLTYANATAALLAPPALIAVARAAARPDERQWRVVSLLLVVGVGATLSRAGCAALAIGLIVLGWRTLRSTLPVLIGAGLATAAVIVVAPASHARRPLLAVAALAAGVAIALMPVHNLRRWLAAAGVLVCGGLAIASAASASRLTVSSPDRSNEWRATWAVATAHPASGVGPSHLDLEWRGGNGDTFVAHATHNEFLQLAAEEGFPALAVVLSTMTLIALALIRRCERPALAVLVAFAVASAFDFVWHVPLLPIVVAALVGVALPFDDRYGRPAPTR